MRPLILALVAALTTATPALAMEHAAGFAAGGTSGGGFAYRILSDGGLGLQISGLFMGSVYGYQSYSLGAEGLWTFQKVSWGRLYGVVGGASSFNNTFIGAGPGIEFGGAKGGRLTIELPVTWSSSFGVLPIPNAALLYDF